MNSILLPSAHVTFRFGLQAERWGLPDRPVVLVLRDGAAPPEDLIAPLVGAGRQVIALQGEGNPVQSAMALSEAAVEIRNLDAVIGQGEGAAAVALALLQGLDARCAVLVAPTATHDLRDVQVPVLIVHDPVVAKRIADFIVGPLAMAA